MKTKQFNIRLPEHTHEQLKKLCETYGTITQVVILAIDRLYQILTQEATNE